MGTFKNKERMEIEANNDPPFRPFIIRRGVPKTLIPEESKVFDETVERNVRFIQGANAFIILGLSYESLKLLYLHYAYRSECEDFSYLILAIIFNNILWIVWSFYAIKAIDSRSSETVGKYFLYIVIITLLRIATYGGTHYVMKEAVIDEQKWYCDAVYQSAVYIFQGVAETLFLPVSYTHLTLPTIYSV
eukprot:TRINITY_DN4581_c0_g1_i3.p1 TRINITY_DN4581_c0_g1~~TRINITY_DN4581_c0_g1_i3.p1  ORF type:complete len:190 (+),score=30.58 TRINITY_DN4581_c0_g1_i3:77-646(+)